MENNSKKNNYSLKFHNRVAELGILKQWADDQSRLAVIHGRRRLGKTRLLRHWHENDDRIAYVLATEGTAATQRAALAEDIEAVVPHFGEVTYPNWRALVRALVAQWPRGDRQRILVIDELPYLVKTAPELPSLLQALVDDPQAAHMPLVLCGSSQRMMQGLVMDDSAPLYGRAQVLLRLRPLPVRDLGVALALDEAPRIVEAYAAWGGVPRYWELAARYGGDLRDAIRSLVLSPSGVLHEEGTRILRDEEAAYLEKAVCQAIGRGARRPSEVSGRLGVQSTTLSKPLRHLVELGLVRREAPYDLAKGRPRERARSSLYALDDPFLAMWYRCVHPYRSGLELLAAAAEEHVWQAWSHHVAAVWESLVRAGWHHLGLDGVVWEAAGRYWEGRTDTGPEWDVVSISVDRRHVLLGECKWRPGLSPAGLVRLVREVKARPRPPSVQGSGATIHEVLFVPCSQELSHEQDGVRLVDAKALLAGSDRTGWE